MRTAAGGIALLLIAAGLFRAEGAFLATALPFAAFAVLGAFFPPPVLSLKASRALSSRFASAGERIRVTLTVRNQGARLEYVSLRDTLPEGLALVDGEATWCGALEAGVELTWSYALEGARGLHAFECLEAEAQDPFTTVKTRSTLPCPCSVAVYPQSFAPPKLAFGAGAVRPFAGRSRAKRIGAGTDFAGTRDYTPGDPLKCLNWRAEALWGRPIVNTFEEERAIDVGIILDCRCEAYVHSDPFEAAAAAALSLAEDFLDRGDRVAFLNYGSLISWTPSGAGREHRLRLRMAAARAELGAHAAFDRFDNLPIRIFPPHSLVLVVSPLRREDVAPLRSLRALGYEVAVLRPDPSPLEEPQAEHGAEPGEHLATRMLGLEREVLFSRLLRAGITILDWHPLQPLAALSHHEGRRA